MKQLASLPLEIEKSHSEYIMQQINKLDASNTRDRSYFDQESNKIQNAINLYNSEAKLYMVIIDIILNLWELIDLWLINIVILLYKNHYFEIFSFIILT